jgi:glycosyltransferase involved in cell wall biosynthesis
LIPVFRSYRRARLLIAGTGRDERPLRALAAGFDHVKFLGFQSGAALRALYRHAAAVIIPSVTLDISPQVALEAFTQRTPVIARRIGGIPEIVEDSGGGIVFEDDASLIAAMDALLDSAHRASLGARGYQAYRTLWTPDAHLERYFALIALAADGRMAIP